MQARIRKEELQTFKEQASNIIVKNNHLDVFKYLKIQVDGDFATITKSNDSSFIVKTIPNDSEDCSFLIDEQTVYDFLEASDSDYVSFADNGSNRILISGGRAKLFSPTEPINLYPVVSVDTGNFIPIPKLACTTAGICSKIIMNGELMNAQSHVFMGKDFVCGSDGQIGYFQALSETAPQIVLRKEVAQTISKMSGCQYAEGVSGGSWDIFKSGETVYGFKKSEIAFFGAIEGLFRGVLDKFTPAFSLPKNQLLKFTSLAISRAPNCPSATFEVTEPNLLHLELVDGEKMQDIHLDVPIRGNEGKFKFAPDFLSTLLKAIPCDDVYLYQAPDRYAITDMDKTFVSLIMRIV